jgi:hypothetical protein
MEVSAHDMSQVSSTCTTVGKPMQDTMRICAKPERKKRKKKPECISVFHEQGGSHSTLPWQSQHTSSSPLAPQHGCKWHVQPMSLDCARSVRLRRALRSQKGPGAHLSTSLLVCTTAEYSDRNLSLKWRSFLMCRRYAPNMSSGMLTF